MNTLKNTLRLFYTAITMLAICCIFSSSAAMAAEPERQYPVTDKRWQWIDSTQYCAIYFDTQTVKFYRDEADKINENIIEVWMRSVYNENGRQAVIDGQKRNGRYNEKWDNFLYDQERLRLKIHQNQLGRTSYFFYNDNGDILLNATFTGSGIIYEDIVAGSFGEHVLQTITKYIKNHQEAIRLRS